VTLTARRYVVVVLVAAAAWLVVAAAALTIGPVNIFGVGGAVQRQMLDGRIGEVVTASLVGAALAVSGAAFQALLRNPLADPYILGVSGGASLGVILGTLVLPPAWLYLRLPLGGTVSLPGVCGFLMALAVIAVVYLIAQRRGRLDPYRLILTGVVASAFFSAAIMLAVALAGDRLRNELIFWLMGGLGSPRDQRGELAVAAVVVMAGLAVFVWQARGFNLLAFGEDVAASLGLDVQRHRRTAFVVASLLAGISVSLAGPIGFVGLIVPHLVRMAFGSDHRLLVPLSVFGGAVFLTVAHRLVLLVPYEVGGGLPVGIVTAMCGVPFFVLLLVCGRGIRGGVL